MDSDKVGKEKMEKEEKVLEIKRQFFHAGNGIVLVTLLYFEILPLWIFFIINITGTVIYFTWEKGSDKFFSWFFHHFERAHAKEGHGALLYAWGCFFTVLFFPENTAFTAILILALGDSVSHYIGRFYGKIKHPLNKRKKAEGTLAGVMAAFAGAALFVPLINAFAAALLVMNAEAIEWKIGKYKIDDNLWIPLVGAGIIEIMYFVV